MPRPAQWLPAITLLIIECKRGVAIGRTRRHAASCRHILTVKYQQCAVSAAGAIECRQRAVVAVRRPVKHHLHAGCRRTAAFQIDHETLGRGGFSGRGELFVRQVTEVDRLFFYSTSVFSRMTFTGGMRLKRKKTG